MGVPSVPAGARRPRTCPRVRREGTIQPPHRTSGVGRRVLPRRADTVRRVGPACLGAAPDGRDHMSDKPFDLLAPLPAGTTVLEASAGTGKTFTIAGLVTRYVAEGVARLDELLV